MTGRAFPVIAKPLLGASRWSGGGRAEWLAGRCQADALYRERPRSTSGTTECHRPHVVARISPPAPGCRSARGTVQRSLGRTFAWLRLIVSAKLLLRPVAAPGLTMREPG